MWDDTWRGIYCACATWKALAQQARRRVQSRYKQFDLLRQQMWSFSTTPNGCTGTRCLFHPTCRVKCERGTFHWLRQDRVWHVICCFLPLWASVISSPERDSLTSPFFPLFSVEGFFSNDGLCLWRIQERIWNWEDNITTSNHPSLPNPQWVAWEPGPSHYMDIIRGHV